MKKSKILIIVLFQNQLDKEPYYALSPAPPLPGILLAALTPKTVDVEVLHEMVRPIDYNTDAQFIAISFMDYLAPHAFEVAARFRSKSKIVIGGGKYISTFPDLAANHFDSILVGEAPGIWPQMVYDMLSGDLKKRYFADFSKSIQNIPPPRYDLVEKKYSVPIVTETSRGCPHSCTYCQLNIKPKPFRVRPVIDVINDLKSTQSLPWHKRKMAMILDNHFGGNIENAKNILREVAKLKFWALGIQFSIECLRDEEFVSLLSEANCRMAFIGMESLNEKSLMSVKKKQNKVSEYKELFERLTTKGILTFAGVMFALDEDTLDYYQSLPDLLDETGVSVILPSIAIPIFGTPLFKSLHQENRIVDYDLSHYEGDHLVFCHKNLSKNEIYTAYKNTNKIFYSWKRVFGRWLGILKKQSKNESISQFILKVLVITFIYYKLSIFQRHHAKKKVLVESNTSVSPLFFSRIKSQIRALSNALFS